MSNWKTGGVIDVVPEPPPRPTRAKSVIPGCVRPGLDVSSGLVGEIGDFPEHGPVGVVKLDIPALHDDLRRQDGLLHLIARQLVAVPPREAWYEAIRHLAPKDLAVEANDRAAVEQGAEVALKWGVETLAQAG